MHKVNDEDGWGFRLGKGSLTDENKNALDISQDPNFHRGGVGGGGVLWGSNHGFTTYQEKANFEVGPS